MVVPCRSRTATNKQEAVKWRDLSEPARPDRFRCCSASCAHAAVRSPHRDCAASTPPPSPWPPSRYVDVSRRFRRNYVTSGDTSNGKRSLDLELCSLCVVRIDRRFRLCSIYVCRGNVFVWLNGVWVSPVCWRMAPLIMYWQWPVSELKCKLLGSCGCLVMYSWEFAVEVAVWKVCLFCARRKSNFVFMFCLETYGSIVIDVKN